MDGESGYFPEDILARQLDIVNEIHRIRARA